MQFSRNYFLSPSSRSSSLLGLVLGLVLASTAALSAQEAPKSSSQSLASLTSPKALGASLETLPEAWRNYPVIPKLDRSSPVFKQFLLEVEENTKRWAQKQSLLPIMLYVYKIRAQESIFTISAKASISVEGIATLNRIEHPNSLPQAGSYILIPNNSGIFLPQNRSSEQFSAWEQRLLATRKEILYHRLVVGQKTYYYYPKASFSQSERRHFLDTAFRSPVQQKLFITSGFGYRRDPISRRSSFHDGLDIRSHYGAPIYSIANGTVSKLGESRLYGLFVEIRLENGKQQTALYGHLTAVLVHKGQHVNAGEVIANSGQSGRSTGPHLHLSIFQGGKAIDPEPLFRNLY